MNVPIDEIRERLAEKGLKVTPQRICILEAVYNSSSHPTVEMIIEHIRKSHPNIATGTVYKVLETLVGSNLIRKVKTDDDVMRYDGIMVPHHHLYCSGSNLIEDYFDRELDELLMNYFQSKKITGFHIDEIVLQIKGTYDKSQLLTKIL